MSGAHSLQGRLLALVVGLVAGVWLLAAAATWFDVRHELDELLDSHLAQAAALLVAQQASDVDDDSDNLDAPSLHRYARKVAFQVFHEGRLVLRSGNAPATPMIDMAEPFQSGFTTVRIEGEAWRVFSAQGGKRDIQVLVGEALESRASILWAVLRSTLWPMTLALPLLALAIWWAVRRGTAPLRRLGRLLTERRPQSLEAVVIADAPAEMVPMLAALNGLFARIEGLMASERRFTADAAHELRTPIAAIRAQAQVALGEPDAGQRSHALLATLAGCDRATRLVEQLLTLSRLEAAMEIGDARVDLSALVRRVVAEIATAAIQKQQALEVEAPLPCVVRGDEILLAVLIRNLVDNAIRYSPERAKIKVSVADAAPSAILRVEDSGPGMGEEDRRRLGERFFRVVGSGESGSGLGWSIVRRIAAVHRAEIGLHASASLGGLAVEVAWPPETASSSDIG